MKSGGTAFLPVTYEPSTGFGPNLNVQDLMGLGSTKATVTGAIFQDRNNSGWYDAGEGLSGVQLVFRGATGQYTIPAMSAGGYNAVVPAGTYTVTASGGPLRFPITKANIQVSNQNVWLNFLYDPNSVPADAYESNNTPGSATLLSSSDQRLTDGTISAGDVDYYRLPATTGGLLSVNLQFPANNGDLDVRLLDAAGSTLATSNTGTAQELLNFPITAGRTYFLVVESHAGGVGGPYALDIDVPPPQAPDGRADSATTALDDAAITINVLANDRDADGDLLAPH